MAMNDDTSEDIREDAPSLPEWHKPALTIQPLVDVTRNGPDFGADGSPYS